MEFHSSKTKWKKKSKMEIKINFEGLNFTEIYIHETQHKYIVHYTEQVRGNKKVE